jgi:hypothetical protein
MVSSIRSRVSRRCTLQSTKREESAMKAKGPGPDREHFGEASLGEAQSSDPPPDPEMLRDEGDEGDEIEEEDEEEGEGAAR